MPQVNLSAEQYKSLAAYGIAVQASAAQAFFRSGGTQEQWEDLTTKVCNLARHNNDVFWLAKIGNPDAIATISEAIQMPYELLGMVDVGGTLAKTLDAQPGTPSPINGVPLSG